MYSFHFFILINNRLSLIILVRFKVIFKIIANYQSTHTFFYQNLKNETFNGK